MIPDKFIESMQTSDYTLEEIAKTVENSTIYRNRDEPFTEEKRKEIRDHVEQVLGKLWEEYIEGRIGNECCLRMLEKYEFYMYDLVNTIYLHAPVKEPSGKTRLDIGRVIGDPKGIKLAADMVREIINNLSIKVKEEYDEEEYDEEDYYTVEEYEARSVGGIGSGSISLAAAVSHINNEWESALCSFSVRMDETGNRIEGRIRSPAVLVFDVIRDAAPVIEAVRYLRQEDIQVDFVIALVCKETKELFEEMEKHGVKLYGVILENDSMPDCDTLQTNIAGLPRKR